MTVARKSRKMTATRKIHSIILIFHRTSTLNPRNSNPKTSSTPLQNRVTQPYGDGTTSWYQSWYQSRIVFSEFSCKTRRKWLIIDSTANKPFFNWSICRKCRKKLFSKGKIEMLKIFKISDQEFHKFW